MNPVVRGANEHDRVLLGRYRHGAPHKATGLGTTRVWSAQGTRLGVTLAYMDQREPQPTATANPWSFKSIRSYIPQQHSAIITATG